MDALQDAVIQSMPRGHLNGDDFHLQVSVVQKAAKTTNATTIASAESLRVAPDSRPALHAPTAPSCPRRQVNG